MNKAILGTIILGIIEMLGILGDLKLLSLILSCFQSYFIFIEVESLSKSKRSSE